MKKLCGRNVILVLVVCMLAVTTAAMAEEPQPVSADNYYGTGNPDAYAWIQIPEMGLDSPILQRKGNDTYYVDHDAQGRKSDTGALFSQSTFNGTNFEETMTTIYGSSAKDNALFGGLQNFFSNDENFFTLKYRTINITVNGHVETWIVFAALPYSPAHMEYYYDFENARVYKSFFDYLAAARNFQSNLDTELFPDVGEQILCLSTSMKEDGSQAYTVFARRLEAVQQTEFNPYVANALLQWNFAPSETYQFTPSATGKLVPPLKEAKLSDGTKIKDKEIYETGDNRNGDPLKDKIDDYLLLTPFAKRDEAPLDEIKDRLDDAYKEIVENDSIADLPAESEQTDNIGFDLKVLLEKLNAQINPENLVVRDLFDITPFGKYKAYIENDEEYMDITFDLHVEPGETVVTLQSTDGEVWNVIPAEMITHNPDGTYTVRLYDLHVIAFAVEAQTAEEIDTTAEDAVLSPIVKKNLEEQ